MIEVQETPDKAVEEMLEAIDFGWCVGGDHLMNPEKCIPIGRIIGIMCRHIPQVNNYFVKLNNNIEV